MEEIWDGIQTATNEPNSITNQSYNHTEKNGEKRANLSSESNILAGYNQKALYINIIFC